MSDEVNVFSAARGQLSGPHDFASGDTAAKDGGLQSCLTLARAHEDIQTFLRNVLMMASLTDFYDYVAKDGWERELESVVTAKVLKPEEKQLQVSRLQMAWQIGRQAAANQDDPLPESVRQMLDQQWKSRYGDFTLEPALTPSSAIYSQVVP